MCAPDDASVLVECYSDDAVVWGTLSPTRRDTPDVLHDYFKGVFDHMPGLAVVFDHEPQVRIYGDTAISSGSYVFSYIRAGEVQTLPARYSFALVNRDDDWLIVDHHSSAMPQPPASIE